MPKITRPAMRYFGGKWKLAPWIISHFPEHRLYIEPFGGSASVLLQKRKAYAEVYNDLDGDIVNVFQVLRDPGTAAELERVCRLTPFSRDELELAHRNRDVKDPVERARRMIVRAYMGFGPDSATRNSASAQGFRSDNNRSYTTPAHDWANWPKQIQGFTRRLRAVVIENRPWQEIIRRYDRDDALFYCDPPYVHSTRSTLKKAKGSTQYAHEMNDQDHRDLAKALHEVKGMVIISGYPSEIYDELYGDWGAAVTMAWSVSGNKGAGAPRTECLWISLKAKAKQNRIEIFDITH